MIIEPRDMPIKEELTHRRKGGAFDMVARILRNVIKISFGTGTTIEDRPGEKEAGGRITGLVDSNSVFEIYQKEPAKNTFNFMVFGKKATNENFNTNYMELLVNSRSSETGPANGYTGLRLTKDGVAYNYAKIALYQSQNYPDLKGDGARVEITGEGQGGGVQIAYVKPDGSYLGLVLDVDGIQMYGLPTTNPGIGNKIWNDGGTLKITPLT